MGSKKIFSMFIGRYQPFHDGHYKLIRSVLDEGKNVLIAVRDTNITEKDPYGTGERMAMINRRFPEAITEGRCLIIAIPDIEEVCYGREVGWGIRQIQLDAETESISATKIREGDAYTPDGTGI